MSEFAQGTEPQYVTLGIGDEEIDLIANDGMRNAAGGIYATRVYEFARSVEKAVLARWHVAPAQGAEPLLRNLLARIHHDGGHYADEHGLEKATADADRIVIDLQGAAQGADERAAYERCAQIVESVPTHQWVDGSDQWGNPCPAKVMTTRSDYAAAIRAALLQPVGAAAEPWPMQGARVDGDTVVISCKGGNDAARWLCGELVQLIEGSK